MAPAGNVSLADLVKATRRLAEDGEPVTHLGICPMSEELIRAPIELAVEHGFPVLFVASRNQVSEDPGGGYVMGFDQQGFMGAIRDIEEACGATAKSTSRPYLRFVSVDHCGPWYKEREKSLDREQALASVKRTLTACVEAGYAGIHIDCTFRPPAGITMDEPAVIEMTADLFEFTEDERKRLGRQPVSYEIGTEETAGAGVSPAHFKDSIDKMLAELRKRGLPKPAFVVGRTGAKIQMLHNLGFDYSAANALPRVAAQSGMGFKEHNADYLSSVILSLHPGFGITGANLGPSFASAQTRALLDLAALEERKAGGDSGLYEIMSRTVLEKAPFHKWLGDSGDWSARDLEGMPGELRAITLLCGHYVYYEDEVKAAIARMHDNLKDSRLMEDPQDYVMAQVKKAIMRCADAFNLPGSTPKLMAAVG